MISVYSQPFWGCLICTDSKQKLPIYSFLRNLSVMIGFFSSLALIFILVLSCTDFCSKIGPNHHLIWKSKNCNGTLGVWYFLYVLPPILSTFFYNYHTERVFIWFFGALVLIFNILMGEAFATMWCWTGFLVYLFYIPWGIYKTNYLIDHDVTTDLSSCELANDPAITNC